ncbi:MAG: hypothetical protein ABIQ95_00875 [Bdellovibrionia bacterium]
MAGRFFLLTFFFALGLLTISFSAESKEQTSLVSPPSPYAPQLYQREWYQKEEGQIPKNPTVPPPLTQRTPPNVSHCERHFLFKGKRLECDSETGKDALGLNPFMRGLPYAESELEIYRENQRKIRFAGFTGTVGVLAMIAGVVISHPVLDPASGSIRPGGFVTLSGIALTANSLIYGLSMMKANEVHIANAVQYHNTARPNQPIELEFSTHIDF